MARKPEETVEDVSDVVEDIVELVEDVGLITDAQEKKILSLVKQYKKLILLAITLVAGAIVFVNSL